MNRTLLLGISIIILVSISGCYAETRADDIYRFINTPYAIDIESGSQASIDVTIKNFGVQHTDVAITSRSLPDGISIVDCGTAKLINTGETVTYPITIAASKDIAPGTYRFEIADTSPDDPHTWETIEVSVDREIAQTDVETAPVTDEDGVPVNEEAPTEPAETPTKKPGVPGFEAVFAIAGLLAVAYLVLRQRE